MQNDNGGMSGAPAPLFLCPNVGYHVSDDHLGSRPAANEVLPDGPISPQTHTDAQYAMLFLADVYSIVLTKPHSVAVKFQGIAIPSCVRRCKHEYPDLQTRISPVDRRAFVVDLCGAFTSLPLQRDVERDLVPPVIQR